MLYRRGGKWWFKFQFAGRTFREPAKTASKTLARDAERKRRMQLEEGYHGLKKRQPPQTLKVASSAWIEMKLPTVSPKTDRVTFHDLRREAASRLLQGGVDLLTVSMLLGHQKATTTDTYLRGREDVVERELREYHERTST